MYLLTVSYLILLSVILLQFKVSCVPISIIKTLVSSYVICS